MAIIVKPKTWNPSDTPVNTDLNSDFDTLYNDYNGNITDANCAAGMALQAAKILYTALTATGPGTQAATQLTTWAEGKLQQLLGTGGTAPSYGQTLFSNATPVSNAASNPADLMTFTLPANTLTSTNRGLRITAFGRCANTATARSVALLFGGTALLTKIMPVSLATIIWRFECEIFRTGLNAQRYCIKVWDWGTATPTLSTTDAAAVLVLFAEGTLAITETASIIIKGQSSVTSTAGDVTQDAMLIEAI